ncbi:MAG: terpene cyclase/mutase family protein [Chlorobi bacterium]|nr:terpene cyclase/mutase family protein [Chlorobiota bacterium]
MDHSSATVGIADRSRRTFLKQAIGGGTLLLIGGSVPTLLSGCNSTTAPTQTLRRAAEYLWGQQSSDGAWRSPQYAMLRSGQAFTPFVLQALLRLPPELLNGRQQQVERGLEFIRGSINADGCIGLGDPDITEYPNYATSYGLRCLAAAGKPSDRPLIERAIGYLQRQQLTEQRGFAPDHLAYGAWGFGSPDLPNGTPGHVDLSHHRMVLQSMREAGVKDQAMYNQAIAFLRLLQKHPSEQRQQPHDRLDEQAVGKVRYDGGFYFSPIVLGANKGLQEPADAGHRPSFRSYATATCDGALALVAAGVPRTDERVGAVRNWLITHPILDRPEGIPEGDPEPWHLALHYYHLAGRCQAYRALGIGGDWPQQAAAIYAAGQQEDGSFRNHHSVLMKEDDPILATALAVAGCQAITQ